LDVKAVILCSSEAEGTLSASLNVVSRYSVENVGDVSQFVVLSKDAEAV
jgi:hypothetical protein